jgi:hypothetical protein
MISCDRSLRRKYYQVNQMGQTCVALDWTHRCSIDGNSLISLPNSGMLWRLNILLLYGPKNPLLLRN